MKLIDDIGITGAANSGNIPSISTNKPRFVDDIGLTTPATNRKTIKGPEPSMLQNAMNLIPDSVSPEDIPNRLKNQPQIIKDLETVPTNFLNQLAMNNIRSSANAGNVPIPFEAQNPAINAVAKGAGVAGMVMSPLNKLAFMKALGKGGLGSKVAAGAVAGAAYAPNDNPLDIGQRGLQAAGSAALTPVVEKVVNPLLEKTAVNLSNKTNEFVDKVLKPPKSVVPNASALEQYKAKAENAFKILNNIKENLNYVKPDGTETMGHVPNTLEEAVQAIPQAKKLYWKTIEDGLDKATGQGIKIQVANDIGKSMDEVINNKAIQAVAPDIINYAQQAKMRFKNIKSMNPSELQEAIATSNKFMSNFYPKNNMNLSPLDVQKAFVDAKVASILRDALDNAMENHAGGQFSALKSDYGSLRTVENELYSALRRNASNNKALSQYVDIFSGGDLAHGLLSGNFGLAGKGLVQSGLNAAKRFVESPDRKLKSVMSSVERFKQNPTGIRANSLADLAVNSVKKGSDFIKDKAKSIGLATAGATSLGTLASTKSEASSSMPKGKVNDEKAINAIIGEAENQGIDGMRAVASAIRNRGTLKGVYGENAPRVKGKKYSKEVYAMAKKAWEDSKNKDYANGANHWENIKAFGKPKWTNKMKQTLKLKDHVFYKG